MICLDAILHASDISNPLKSWDTYVHWTSKVMEEFWIQVKSFLFNPYTYMLRETRKKN